MPPKVYQGTLIILDIGKNTIVSEKNKKSFFEDAVECVKRIIERKIMSKGNHYVGIILLGSAKTKNNLSEQCNGAFKHVELFSELQTPTWGMIRNLPSSPTKKKGDWLDAIIVAADHFKNGVSGVKISSKKIVLLTNFENPSKFNVDVDQVLKGFKDEQFEVDVIGLNIEDEVYDKNEDILVARQFVMETDGATEDFDNTMRYLLFHRKKFVNAVAWNVDLSIGPNIKIPVSTYIRLKDEPIVPTWMKAVKDPITDRASTTEAIEKSKVFVNTDNQKLSKVKEAIKGYVYGQKIIPFSDCDKCMLYQPGEKSLTVYGFTHAKNIQWHNLNGDGLSYLFGRKGDSKAQYAIRCLVECLHELNLVGIVRKVYNNGNPPKMNALMPVIDTDNYICLSLVSICYKEDIKYMAFPQVNLKKFDSTEQQVNAFKDLIKAMDLNSAYDEEYADKEAFPVASTVSPAAQYVLDCIAFRAMNPGKPLPPPRDEILTLFKVPPLIEKRSKAPLEALKKLFTLTKVEAKTRKRKILVSDNIVIQNQDPNNLTMDIDMPRIKLPKSQPSIGTADPIHDFKESIQADKKLSDLVPELTEAIESIVYSNLDGTYTKALHVIEFFRTECVNSDPSHYNTWLKKFKADLTNDRKHDLIEVLCKKNLNYIMKDENELSTLEAQSNPDESQLFENDTIPETADLEIKSDVNDMFDEM